MCLRVLPADVRAEFQISVPSCVRGRGSPFCAVVDRRILLAPRNSPSLQGHVEAWQACRSIECRARDVVNSKSGFANQPKNLVNPHFAGVAHFLGGARNVACVVDGEDQGVEERIGRYRAIERTVDKDVLLVGRRGRHLRAINRRDVLAWWSLPTSETDPWTTWTNPGGHRAVRSSR